MSKGSEIEDRLSRQRGRLIGFCIWLGLFLLGVLLFIACIPDYIWFMHQMGKH